MGKNRCSLVLSLLLLLVLLGDTNSASADFIEIVAQHETRVHPETREVWFSFKLENIGDEAAFDLAVEVLPTNESYLAAKTLSPGESTAVEFSLPSEGLLGERSGRYIVPCRIIYKDGNLYPLSSPYIVELSVPPNPGRVVSLRLREVRGSEPVQLEVLGPRTVTVELVNVSTGPITVESSGVIPPAEIMARPTLPELPLVMPQNARVEFPVSVENSMAIENSTYALAVFASGISGEKHFAEHLTFHVQIVPERRWRKSKDLITLLMPAFVLLALVWTLRGWQKKRS